MRQFDFLFKNRCTHTLLILIITKILIITITIIIIIIIIITDNEGLHQKLTSLEQLMYS